MTPIIFHADLDAFYASVEQLDKPSLKGQPLVVGALPGRRGVVSACSYEARSFGIHSAMPISTAYKLCPNAHFLPVRMKRYNEASLELMALFRSFAPAVRQISIDEAFLDMSGTALVYGPPLKAGAALKQLVREKTGLALSIGIGANRYIAKLASAKSKPDGLLYIPKGEEEAFLDSIPLYKLWGVGEKTAERLRSLGFTDVPGLRAVSLNGLRSLFGEAVSSFLYSIVRGQDPGIFSDSPKSHSISGERTYEHDVKSEEILENTLLELAEELRFRLMAEGAHSKTVQLKLRYDDFQTVSIRESGGSEFESIEDIYASARRLLRRKREPGRAIRLIGLALVNTVNASTESQGELFAKADDKRERVEKAILDLRKKRGAIITKARLVKPEPPSGD